MIDKVKAQSRHRKNTDQNTTKTPIEMPQKHRFVWNHHNLCTLKNRYAANTANTRPCSFLVTKLLRLFR